jgi:protein-S-isoprenylcysteine O-methyltransferase Ste14
MIGVFDILQLAVMAVYLGLLIGRTVQLRLASGVRSFALGSGKSGLPALLERILFPALVLWWTETVLYTFHSTFHIFPRPLDGKLLDGIAWEVAGSVLLLCACALFAWALVSFGASWRVGIDTQHPGSLVTGGVFAFSRNPIFLSIDMYFIGAFLLNGTVFFLAAAVLAVAGMHYQILQEEEHLRKQYGEAYRAYCATTGRYIGRRLHDRQIRTGRCFHIR